MNKRRKQAGYTLVELITTTVVIAALSAFGVGQYSDLHHEARTAAAQGLASSLGSASVSNFLVRSRAPAPNTVPVANCTDTAALLMSGAIGQYTILSKPIAAGAIETCTLVHMGQPTGATFVAHGTN